MMAEAPGVCDGIAVGSFVCHKRCKDMNVDVPVVCGDIGSVSSGMLGLNGDTIVSEFVLCVGRSRPREAIDALI
jgi:hypothetical protein